MSGAHLVAKNDELSRLLNEQTNRALIALSANSALVAALESLKPHSKWLHLVAERLQKQQRDYSIANTCEEAADAIDAALKAAQVQP